MSVRSGSDPPWALRGTTADVRLLVKWGVGEENLYAAGSTASISARVEIAELLHKLGHEDKSLSVLGSLFRDRTHLQDLVAAGVVDVAIGLWAELARALGKGKREVVAQHLALLLRNSDASYATFDTVMRLVRDARFDWAAPLVEEIALDDDVDDWRRCEAALALTVMGNIDRARRIIWLLSDTLNDSYARAYVGEQAGKIFDMDSG
jgi:hypothetical protein